MRGYRHRPPETNPKRAGFLDRLRRDKGRGLIQSSATSGAESRSAVGCFVWHGWMGRTLAHNTCEQDRGPVRRACTLSPVGETTRGKSQSRVSVRPCCRPNTCILCTSCKEVRFDSFALHTCQICRVKDTEFSAAVTGADCPYGEPALIQTLYTYPLVSEEASHTQSRI